MRKERKGGKMLAEIKLWVKREKNISVKKLLYLQVFLQNAISSISFIILATHYDYKKKKSC